MADPPAAKQPLTFRVAEFEGRTAVPLIVICLCAVVRRVVAP